MTLRFGTDGVRGRALSELSPQYVYLLGRAAATVLGPGEWLVGRDPRESGPQLADAVMAGLAAAGATPIDVGVVPTPTLAYASAQRNVAAAMVTASHNPWHDNGVKLFAAGGRKLSDHVEAAIETELDGALDTAIGVPGVSAGGFKPSAIADAYLDAVCAEAGSLDGMRVVLDTANGAMSQIAPMALRRVGAVVHVINDTPDGRNINDRCGATDTAALRQAVLDQQAELGLAFDGDGDRVIAVDHTGAVVDGDRLIALAALDLRRQGRLHGDTVVVTVMSNLGFHRAMAAAGVSVVTTPVGDRYVLEALEAHGYSIGGEQSGHIIYRDIASTGDGLLAGVKLASAVRAAGVPLHQLATDVMHRYPQVLINVAVSERHPDAAAELADEIAAAEAVLAGDGRVLVRASGTEPLVRVMVEAATDEIARGVADGLADTVRNRWS